MKWKQVVGLYNYQEHRPSPIIPTTDSMSKCIPLPPPVIENTQNNIPPSGDGIIAGSEQPFEDEPQGENTIMDTVQQTDSTAHPLRRSSRVGRPTQRFLDSVARQDLNFQDLELNLVGSQTI